MNRSHSSRLDLPALAKLLGAKVAGRGRRAGAQLSGSYRETVCRYRIMQIDTVAPWRFCKHHIVIWSCRIMPVWARVSLDTT